MFPEDALFEYVLIALAEAAAGFVAPSPDPMRCDRYIARSALQKACRRGEVSIAWSALANLCAYDARAMWRSLVVIALEDVGAAGMDVVAAVIAASRSKVARAKVGDDWAIACLLVRQMCESMHCQAACDLLLRCLNDAALEVDRAQVLDDDRIMLAEVLSDAAQPIERRGLSILALGGGLADGQQYRDPHAVFDLLADAGYGSHVVATCRAAWKTSRNEMAMLLPLVWREWMIDDTHFVADDPMLPVTMIGDVPGYAIDQFTRIGGDVARAMLRADDRMVDMLDHAGVRRNLQPRAVGDLLFLIEGGQLKRRCIWAFGDRLRLPCRMLATVSQLGGSLDVELTSIIAKGSFISDLRAEHLHHHPHAARS